MENLKNTAEISKLIDLLRKKGVEFIKDGEFEIRLRSEAPPSNYKKKTDPTAEVESEVPFSDMDALFWSSAGIPDERAN